MDRNLELRRRETLGVLVVEDDPVDAEMAVVSLECAGWVRFEATRVSTLGEALGCLARSRWDVVLLDRELPDARGEEGLVALLEAHPEVPVVVLTAHEDPRLGEESVRLGAQDYLCKAELVAGGLARALCHAVERKRRERAVEASAAKSTYLAHLTHDLRTPLNGLLGLIHLLGGTRLDRTQQEYVELMESAAAGLLGLVENVLDLSHIEAGTVELCERDFALRPLLDRNLRCYVHEAERRGVALRCQVSADVPPAVRGDPDRLWQVLSNLVGNALKFTEKGSVRVCVELESQEGELMVLAFSVRDTGSGIPLTERDRLFLPFTRGAEGRPGVGLGLAICAGLVERMGGAFQVESEPGRGTELRFTARLRRAVRVLEEAPAPAPVGAPLHILLVEDDRTNALVARRVLEHRGHQVVLATDGRQAEEALAGGPFDVVITDLAMPRLDGWQLAARIRAAEGDPASRTPLVAFTACATVEDRERCRLAGMDAYLSKPLVPEVLIATVEALGEDRAGRRRAVS